MKIGISDIYLDAMGGGEKYMLSLASCLSEQSDVDFFWDNEEIFEKAKQRFSISLDRITIVPNIFSSTTSTLTRIKGTKKYDVIVHLSDGSIPLSFAKRTYLHIQHPINWINTLSFMNRIKLSFIQSIICNSEYTKQSVERVFHKPCVVLYPPSQIIGEGDKKENMILTIGRYNKLKEGDDFKKLGKMIEFFKEYVDKTGSTYHFVLVVSFKKEDEEEVQKLKESIGKYNIQIMSDLSNEELVMLYKRAKIYWHAAGYQEDLSLHPERAEHFGISVVEAMSAGAVPVVIDAGGIPEIVTHGEDGFLWKNKEELFTFTQQITEEKETEERIRKNGIKRSLDFSEAAFFEKVKKLFYE